MVILIPFCSSVGCSSSLRKTVYSYLMPESHSDSQGRIFRSFLRFWARYLNSNTLQILNVSSETFGKLKIPQVFRKVGKQMVDVSMILDFFCISFFLRKYLS